MTRINTNVPSLVAQNRLRASNEDLQQSLTRLSTGLRINSGADDPAGLIASEALRSEVTSMSRAISNTRRASQIISTADSALGQVSNLINDIRGLVVEAANSGALSDEEIAANQLQIDSSLEAINRIAQTTTFQGRKLLDGSQDFTTTMGAVETLRDGEVDQANLGATGRIDVDVSISSPAEQAEITAETSAFTTSGSAQATTTFAAETATLDFGGGNEIEVTGQFTSVEIVNDPGHDAAALASIDANGKLTITIDDATGTATDFDLTAIQATIQNDVPGIAATLSGVATTAGTALAELPGNATTLGLELTAATAGAAFNNVEIEYVLDSSADGPGAGDVEAEFDPTQRRLTITSGAGDIAVSEYLSAIAAEGTFTGELVDAAGDPAASQLASFTLNQETDTLLASDTALTGGEVLRDSLVFQLNGSSGAETFNFEAGTSAAQIAAAVNLVRDSTGVAASVENGLTFTSSDYGRNALVNLEVISEGDSGTFKSGLSSARDEGVDIAATVNGITANGTGNTLSINTSSLDLSLTVNDGDDSNFSFSITGGGALFQLGPDVTSNQQARLGVGSVSTGQLGGSAGRLYELGSGQAKSLKNDVTGAAQIVDEVVDKVTSLRGRLGAFQATSLASNLVSLNETLANLEEAESSIRDADFALETANLTRAQILVQSGTNVLSLANQNPQNVLSLLR